MATAKKSTKTVKKSPSKAAKVSKVTKTVKVVKAKPSHKAKKVAKVQSFHLSPEEYSFLNFKFTEQTIYWIILLAMIFILSIWVLNIQLSTNDIINSIN